MRFISTALLVLFGAEPFTDAILKSPLAPAIAQLQHSEVVASVFGKPDVLLQAMFVLVCYELVRILDTWLFNAGPMMVSVSQAPCFAGRQGSVKSLAPLPTAVSGNLSSTLVKKPD